MGIHGIQLKLGLGIHFGDSRDSRDSVKTCLGIHFGDSWDSRDSVKKNIGLEHMKPATPPSMYPKSASDALNEVRNRSNSTMS